MAHTSFGNFLNGNYNVKFKENIDQEQLDYFKNIGYSDYRVGCDLCECGNACGIKTNIGKFVNTDWFQLNQLEIDFDNTWYSDEDKLKLKTMYETSNKKIIEQIYNYYLNFNKVDGQIEYNININLTHTSDAGNSGLTSAFWKEPDVANGDFTSCISPEELTEIKNVHLCGQCFKWFITVHENTKNQFVKQNPLKYFWFDFVEFDLHELIDWESVQMKDKFYNYYDGV